MSDRGMPWSVLRASLADAAARKGWRVVVEPLGDEEVLARPGSCRLRGERRIYLDAGAGDRAAVIALAEALAGEDLDDLYLLPAARTLCEEIRGRTRRRSG